MLTVRQLKEYLVQLEENWTEEDLLYLGEVDDQYVCCITASTPGVDKVYGVIYDACFGLMLTDRSYDHDQEQCS